MASFLGNAVLLMMLLLFTGAAESSPDKRYLKLTNNLTGNLNLTLGCAANLTAIGQQVLPPHAAFEFGFDRHATISCSAEWPGLRLFSWFYSYSPEDHQDNCTYWKIVQDGPCMFNSTTKKEDCLPWMRDDDE
ncbi:hypothetical protein L3X38_001150 [Prunus dulcis]|uniref:S-protein homolog n=1 Tax=Prunus dulcis TaxID=3755 RepID=A0AAD4ZK23_PRUDU|nr:hypothetical protein L3X38_001150 [Prunus dulcis]